MQDGIRQHACVGMGKAFYKHVSSKWLPPEDYQPAKGKGRSKAKGKPVRGWEERTGVRGEDVDFRECDVFRR